MVGETNSEAIGANSVIEELHGGTIIDNVIDYGAACKLCRGASNALRLMREICPARFPADSGGPITERVRKPPPPMLLCIPNGVEVSPADRVITRVGYMPLGPTLNSVTGVIEGGHLGPLSFEVM